MKIRLLAVAGTLALLTGTEANAQQIGRPTVNIGNWYVGAEAGGIIPDDISYRVSGTVSGVPSSVSGNLSFNAGPEVGGFVGYHFNNYLAGEGDFFYGNFDFDQLTANFSGIVKGSAAASVNGSTDTETVLANAIVTPFGRSTFTPYIGGGVGFTNHDSTVNSISALGVTIPVNASSSALDLAANAIVGIDWAGSDRWSLGARYRFLWVDLSSVGCPSGGTCSQGSFTAHVVTANATFHF